MEKEGRGEYIVGFAGLSDAGHRAAENGLTEAERKTWGLWTARGAEGISYVIARLQKESC